MVHLPEERRLQARHLVVLGTILLSLAVFALRLWFLQYVDAPELRRKAESGSEASVDRLAPRGRIYDRKGRLIAGVRPTVVVTARPAIALKHPETIELVANKLGVTPKRLKAKIEEYASVGHLAAGVHVGASVEVGTWIAENTYRLPGFGVETQPMRYYAAPTELAHALGYVRQPREQDVARIADQGLKPAAYVGLAGLERQYEAELMGRPGAEKVAVDVRRRPLRSLGTEHPTPGHDLVLSIDLDLQRYAYALLAGRPGSVVALEPRTGEVICLVSAPTYDASLFLGGIGEGEYAALRDHPLRPLFPRALAAAYAPGSTFKIVTAIAGQLAGVFDPDRPASCRGYYQVGNKRFKCLGYHGSVTFDRAMTKSCNAYFADLGMRAGPEAILRACEMVGIGAKTGIDVPIEAKGTLPTPDWWAKHRDRKFSGGDTVNLSVGQGELAVTPLQMACVIALAANRGVSFRPHLVKAIKDPDGERAVVPQGLAKVEAPPEFWNTLVQALGHVVSEGTARGGYIEGVAWGGKTGSAEHRKDSETHSWFVGFAPLDNPRIALCVMVEQAGHGSEAAVPVASALVRRFLFGLPPAQSSMASREASASALATIAVSPAAPASDLSSSTAR